MLRTSLRAVVAALLALVLLQSAIVGQTYFHIPSDTPATGTCNVFPWGQSSTRHQHIVTAAELGNAATTINDIAYAACNSGTFTCSQILIRMDHYTGTTLNGTFASNLSANPTTVLNATNWSYPYAQHTWVDVGLTNPFSYDPSLGNLVIDIEFCGASGGTSFHRDVSPRCWSNGGPCPSNASGTAAIGALKVRVSTGTDGNHSVYGQGCGTPALTLSGSGIPNIGANSTTILSNGTPSALAAYGVGLFSANTSLASIGAPGCTMYTNPIATVLVALDGSGTAPPFDIPIPNNASFVGVMLYTSGASVDPPQNAAGLTTANGIETRIGM